MAVNELAQLALNWSSDNIPMVLSRKNANCTSLLRKIASDAGTGLGLTRGLAFLVFPLLYNRRNLDRAY